MPKSPTTTRPRESQMYTTLSLHAKMLFLWFKPTVTMEQGATSSTKMIHIKHFDEDCKESQNMISNEDLDVYKSSTESFDKKMVLRAKV